jgi:hypothetical protein
MHDRRFLCGFTASCDATMLARATDASTASQPDAAEVHSFVLDGSAAKKLLTIAGPGEKHRHPRARALDRWKSQARL